MKTPSPCTAYRKRYTQPKRVASNPRQKPPKKPRLACVFFAAKGGTEPVRDWLKSLTKNVRSEVGTDIARVQWRWPISKPLVGAFGEGLYEVRTSVDGNIYRVFFCVEGTTMILLHAFMKKTQKTPERDIAIARDRQKEVTS